MKIEYSIFTDKGSRPINEDFAGYIKKDGAYCFVLCDGLGGHGMGDRASQLAVKAIKEYFMSCPGTAEFVSGVIDHTQSVIRSEQAKNGSSDKMKTTAVILVIDGNRGEAVHVGDSRAYHFRDGRVLMHTRDHSIPQMLVLMGEIDESMIRSHPDRNMLLRALGDDREQVKYDVSGFDISEGDYFLLCSDGFWEPVTEDEMLLTDGDGESAEKWIKRLSGLAYENSSGKKMDNYTAVGVIVKG